MACPTVILSGYNLPKINRLDVISRIFFKQVSADLHHLRFHLMYLHIQNLSNCCICMIGQFIQCFILDGFLKLGPTLHAPIQWKRAGLKTGTATGESSNKNAPTPRPASPHFVTECKNREMMRRTKYVVVHFFFKQQGWACTWQNWHSESSFVI